MDEKSKVKTVRARVFSLSVGNRYTVQGGLRTCYYHNYIIATTKKIVVLDIQSEQRVRDMIRLRFYG